MLTAAHMVEHSILSGILAPAIVLAWRALPLAPPRVRHPAVAWTGFVVVQWVFHLTPLLVIAEDHALLHAALHVAFIAVGVWFWVPILAPAGWALGDPARALYLFFAAPAIDLVGVMLISRGEQAAGVAMIAGGMPIVVAAIATLWAWMEREQREASAVEARRVAAG